VILVTEAGYHGMVAFSACSTLPLSASIRSSASAFTAHGARSAAQASVAANRLNRDLRSSGRRACTIRFPVLGDPPDTVGSRDLMFGSEIRRRRLRRRKPIPAVA